ncbi:autotransporter-associated beta strand repeat-containing protein [Xanthobacteraceae bacterium A53D]
MAITSQTTLFGTTTCVDWTGGNFSITSSGSISGDIYATGTLIGLIARTTNSTLNTNGRIVLSAGTIAGVGTRAGALFNAGTLVSATNGGTISASGVITNTAGFNNMIAGVGNMLAPSRIGLLTNTGTITATGSIATSGFVPGGSSPNVIAGIANMAGTIAAISNAGLISVAAAAQDGQSGLAAIFNQSVIETVSNMGRLASTITSGNPYAVGIYNHTGGTIGTIVNASVATISGGTAILNKGRIGTIINNGMISARAGVWAQSGSIGSLTNNGSIVANISAALSVSDGATVLSVLNNTGAFMSGTSGVNNGGSIGTLTNAGTLLGQYTGIGNASTGAIGFINNGGSILAAGTSPSGISNDGHIGALANSGLLSGNLHGIHNSGTIGALSNSGTITGAEYAIRNNLGAVLDTVENTGIVSGNIINESSRALTITGGTGTIVGTLTGASGGLGSADKGTITNTASELVFASGNILLNDNVTVTGHTLTNSANLTLANSIMLTGYYAQDGGTLSGGTLTTSGTSFLMRSGLASSVLAGTGGLTKSTAGTITLSGANTYTGATSITAGVLSISNGSALGGATQGTSVSSGATLVLSGDIAVGAEALTIAGLGASGLSGALVNLSGTNSLGGPITLAAASAIASNSGTLVLSGGIGGTFDLTLTGAGNGTVSGAIATGSGTLTKVGTGTWSLSGSNTYSGNTNILAGILQISNGSALGGTTSLATVSSGATLQVFGDITAQKAIRLSGTGATGATGALENVSGANTISGNVQLLADSTVSVDAGTLTLSGGLSGTGYTLDLVGTGTLVLSGSSAATQTNVGSGITLQIGAGGTTGSLSGSIVNSGALVVNRSNQSIYADVISGSGGLTKLGADALYLTGNNTYTGTTTVSAGTLYMGAGGTTGSIAGNVVNNSAFAFYRSNAVSYGGVISGTGQVGVGGGGTVTLTGTNSYTGGTWIAAATLHIGDGGTAGSVLGNIATEYVGVAGALVFNRSDDLSYAGVISGVGTLTKQGAGVLTLTGENTLTGGTTISAGTLQIGNGGTTGSLTGAIGNSGTLIFNRSNAVTAGSISGTGQLIQRGTGTTTLTGTNGAGSTTIEAGTLALQAAALLNSGVTVQSGGTLAGLGFGGAQVNGTVTVLNGGSIAATGGGAGYGLSMSNLVLNNSSNVNVALGGNAGQAAIQAGALTLDGTLNVTNAGGMTFGTYRVIDYTTQTADNGLVLGSVPFGFGGEIQTSVANQVNLVVGAYSLFWNGSTTTADGTIHGGNGTWASGGATNWTNAAGTVAGAWSGGTAIFQGAPGTVTVDTSGGAVNVSAMQFGVNGYVVSGGDLTLTGTGQTGIRVGDGTTASAGYTATIGSALVGTSGLDKRDLGTLVLTGTNTYTGGTTVTAGTLQMGDGITTGSLVGDVVNNANLLFYPGAALTYSGAISGTGSLFKQGSGTLTLTGTNTFTGGTSVTGGRLVISGGSSLSDSNGLVVGAAGTVELLDANETVGWLSGSGAVALNANCLTVAGGGTTFSGSVSGSGCLNKSGTGTLTLSGTNTFSGGTTISEGAILVTSAAALGTGGLNLQGQGALQANGTFTYTGGISLAPISGSGGGTFQVADAETLTLSGAVSGAGALTKTGAGTLVLSGTNTYSGATNVDVGTLVASGGQAIGDTSAVSVATGATFVLQNDETIGGLIGAGSVQLAGGSLTLGGDNTSTTYSGVMSGTGGLTKTGSGTLSLTGTNTFTGTTTVASGALALSGAVGGDVTVQNLANLSGGGTVAGTVTVQDGGTLSGTQTSGLTMGGLSLAANATLGVTLGTPSVASGIFTVNGDVTLDGTLAVTTSTGFGFGVYRVINYTGALTNNGMTLTGVPTGLSGGIQTAVANQVNLFIDDPDSPVQFWNGSTTTPNEVIVGGTGTWTAGNQTNWTNASATVANSWNGGYAVFQGTAGTVTVDNGAGQVTASGMQFATGGYLVTGGSIALASMDGTPIIRVGDGTSGGVTMVATIASVLTGTQGMAKTDFGTLILAGDNTYTGGTNIVGGTLQLGNGGTSGSILGDVVNDGALVFNRSDAVTFAGTISGSGSVKQAGPGVLALTGTNTYSGGTSINAGTVQIASASALGSGPLAIAGGATLGVSGSSTFAGGVTLGAGTGTVQVDPAQSFVIRGTVSGTGALAKTGDGTLSLTGENTYSGGTTVSSGALILATSTAAGTGQINMLAGTTLGYANGIDLANALHITGVVELAVAAGSAVQTGALTGTGSYVITGPGTLKLVSTSSFTGTTAVDGTLAVNGSLGGGVTVNDGGTLKGSGTVGSTTVLSGGTVAPGNSIGTLNVAGNISFAAGSVYEVEVNAAGASDLIAATGTATLAGGTVQVLAAAGTYSPLTTYTILTATGGVLGSFGAVTSNFAYLTPELDYDGGAVYLSLQRNDLAFCLPGFTGNQCNTGTAVQALGSGNTLYDAVVSLDAVSAGVAFDALSGQAYASAQAAALQDSRFTRDAAFDRLRSASGGVGATGGVVARYADAPPLAYASPAKAPLGNPLANMPLPGTTTEVWMQGFGAWGDFSGGNGTSQLDRSIGGFYIGADRLILDGWRLGALAGYSRSSMNVDGLRSSLSSDNYTFGLYAGRQWGALGLRLGAAYTWHDVAANRTVAFPGFNNQLEAGYSADTMQIFGELGYQFRTGGVDFEPFASLAYVRYSADAFTETGGPAALSVTAQAADTTFSTLGVRVAAPVFSSGGSVITARGMIGWKYAFEMPASAASVAFAGGTPFNVTGAPLAQNAAVLEAGFDTLLATDTTLSVSYAGQFGVGFSDNAIQAALSWRF